MPKKAKKEDVWQQDKGTHAHGRPRGRRQPPKGNAQFDEFFKRQRIVESDAEWAEFMAAALTSLPACFRVTSGRYAAGIRARLAADDAWGLEGLQAPDGVTDDGVFTVHPPKPVDWLPPGYAWSINAPRPVIRKCPQLKAFHQWLVMQNGQGNINRQEAVSMIPPLLLDVRPGMKVLDLCAAPGSKTAQLVDFLQAGDPHARDRGLVVANDSDTSRCYMLVHQLKRFAGDSIVVTNHMAQNFPLLRKGCGDAKTDGIQFDRVLCDVPCSGDGTMRKSPDVWMKWKSGTGLGMHSLQVSILVRGIELCSVGGRVVYSTCSLNPYENEAVVAEAVRRFGGKVVVEDVSSELPQLKRKPGLETWGVRDPNKPVWYDSAEDVPETQRSKIPSSIWPPSSAEEAAGLGLSHALRLLPHLQDTGGFFVCVLTKREALLKGHDYNLGSEAEPEKQRQPRRTDATAPKGKRQRHQGYVGTGASAATADPTATTSNDTAAPDDSRIDAGRDGIEHSETQATKGAAIAASVVATTPELAAAKAEVETTEKVKGPRGREMDPRELVFEAAIAERNNPTLTKSITDLGAHYGLPDDFPYDQLYTRGNDDMCKRLALVSSAAKYLLEMDTSKQLKVVNAGCKVFNDTTRQGMNDKNWGSASSNFRLTQESIGLMLPMLGKRVVCVTAEDMCQIVRDALQLNTEANTYGNTNIAADGTSVLSARTVESLGKVTPGCCVLVLGAGSVADEGTHGVDTLSTSAPTGSDSSIAPAFDQLVVTSWKGWRNLTVFVEKDELLSIASMLSIK